MYGIQKLKEVHIFFHRWIIKLEECPQMEKRKDGMKMTAGKMFRQKRRRKRLNDEERRFGLKLHP